MLARHNATVYLYILTTNLRVFQRLDTYAFLAKVLVAIMVQATLSHLTKKKQNARRPRIKDERHDIENEIGNTRVICMLGRCLRVAFVAT